ncbi:DivIVA domain-containing protein [Actinocorallia herbida]|uniref:Cell wall synthesis protein Wag31 n=1 Tax=Actinocorallia herbida TaxID=58109 RepID=A0A3N1CML8_9ACTN|nr:DivIVA domain-containing protein [Actinocorallia herbida]ROO82550.1 DivIVA domain-containing protein [Actinocorallia herbida]
METFNAEEAVQSLNTKVDRLTELVESFAIPAKARHAVDAHRITPMDIRRVKFVSTRLAPGYVQSEVDEFLDKVEAEIGSLIVERDAARDEAAKLREELSAAAAPQEGMA